MTGLLSINYKKIKNISRNMFVKIFLVCTSISFFIVTILGFYTHYYILKNFNDEIERFEQLKISETLSNIKIIFSEMEKIVLDYAMNKKFMQFALLPREYVSLKQDEIRNIQDMMASSINSSNYIKNIFVYFEDNGYILDYSAPMDIDQYYDLGWLNAYNSFDELSAILDTRQVKIRTADASVNYENIITIIASIPYTKGEEKKGAIVLNVDANILSDQLRNITLGNNDSLAFMINHEGKIVASSENRYILSDISKIINVPDSIYSMDIGSFKLKFGDSEMISYFENTGINDWKILYLVSENKVYQKSIHLRNITLFIFSLLFILVSGISLLLSIKLYKPIRKIINNLRKISNLNNEDRTDISMIQDSIDMLLSNNTYLEQQLSQNNLLMREMFLSNLITGKLFNRIEIMKKASFFNIDFEYDFFKVAIIQYSLNGAAYDLRENQLKNLSIINIIKKVFDTLKIDTECTQDNDDNILILFKFYTNNNTNETQGIIDQSLEEIQDILVKRLNMKVNIGIGQVCDDLSGIGVSYHEALKALQYKFIKDEHSIINYSDIGIDEKEELYYPVEYEQKIITLVKLCEYNETITIINAMISDIMQHNKNFEHIEVCLNNMAGLIQRCVYELNLSIKEVFKDCNDLNIPIESFGSITRFTDWLADKIRIIIDYLTEQQKDSAKSFTAEIKEYIDKKYTEEISLISVAEDFNYNASYFCKIFKEKIGVSFWEYVSKVRIEKSKQLLLETNESIEKVAQMVGYNNRFSYIRTFKKYVSVTPSEYRLKNYST